ncbi:cupin domain-containing protein [Rhizomonospora bruguierae]|uniref:cupin domain-containing protein n=1 Tax=Rhizomonospora bruguierae TaxID=1581705 RepID=UPI001BCB4DEB|nr:cupin domain-containing protein [Micromonospora sp. NBRC 107566]
MTRVAVNEDATVPGGPDRPALRRCVSVEPGAFAEGYWGREALLSAGADVHSRFADLLSVDDVDELLSRRGLRTPFLRLADRGRVVPGREFTGPGGAGAEISDQVLDERVLARYASGATVVLQGLHRLWPPLAAFAGQLARDLGAPVQVNAYLTPPQSQGFATHYDTHDVFVLQVAGRKRWRIHRPVLPEPLEAQAWGGRAGEVAAVADGEPELDVDLEPGDALYLPRGWLHSAQALGERTLHLTCGIRALTRYALVEALAGLAAEHRSLRAGFPMGLDLSDPDQLTAPLAQTVAALRDWLGTVEPATVAERLRPRVWSATRPDPIRPVAQAAAAAGADAETLIEPRRGLRWRLDGADGGVAPGRVALRLPDRTVTFPAFCAAALRAALTANDPVRVGDLPGLDDDHDRVVLARRLLREAVAVPAEKPVP